MGTNGRVRQMAALLILSVTTAFCAARPSAGDTLQTAPSSTPEGAVGQASVALGGTYAGDCVSTRSPDDIGKLCSKLAGQCGNIDAYEVGMTFSEYNVWVFVQQGADGWSPLATLSFNATAQSPAVPWPAGCAGSDAQTAQQPAH